MFGNNLKVIILMVLNVFVARNLYANTILIRCNSIEKSYPITPIDSTKTEVIIKIRIFKGEQKATLIDLKYFVYKNYFLQLEINPHLDRKVTTDKTGSVKIKDTLTMRLDGYRLTDMNKKVCTWFNLKSPPQVKTKKNIWDTAKQDSNKSSVLTMSSLLKTYQLNEFKKEKDTIINYHNCQIIICNKEKMIDFDNKTATAKFLRLIIDKDVKHFSLRMADKKLYNYYGGVVINIDQILDNGVTLKLEFQYEDLNDNKKALIDSCVRAAAVYVQK